MYQLLNTSDWIGMKRGKRNCLVSIFVVMIMLLSQSVAYAETAWEVGAKEIGIVKEFSNANMARMIGMPRGQLISSFEISITDRGNGTVGLFGDVLCHEPMSEIRMNLYLDIWNDTDSDWENVDDYQFIWKASDIPGEDLTAAVVAFDVKGLERGRDYRLRGLAGARNLDSTLQESWRGETSTIQVQSLN